MGQSSRNVDTLSLLPLLLLEQHPLAQG